MKIIPTLTLLFMLSYTSFASALPVRLDMLGTVSYTTVPGVVDVGDPFQLSIFYNHNAPASVTGPTSAIYTTNHITRLDIGGLFLAGSEGGITVYNDHLICQNRACFLLDLLRISSRSFDSMIGDYEVNNIVLD